MSNFQGSLQLAGDDSSLPVTIAVAGGRLAVKAGEHLIGNWAVDGIGVERIGDRFRILAESEYMMITVGSPDLFMAALSSDPADESEGLWAETAPPQGSELTTTDDPAPTIEPFIAAAPQPVPAQEPKAATPEPPPPVQEAAVAETPDAEARPKSKGKAHRKKKPKKWLTPLLLAVIAIALWFFFPDAVNLVLMILGMILLLVAVAVTSDSFLASRLPARITSTGWLTTGAGMLALGMILTFLT